MATWIPTYEQYRGRAAGVLWGEVAQADDLDRGRAAGVLWGEVAQADDLDGLRKTMLHRLERHLRVCALPESSSIGRCTDGSGSFWATSSLKEYPSGFCSLLAAFFQVWLNERMHLPPSDNRGEFPWIDKLCQTLAECESRPCAGPDFFQGDALLIKNLDVLGAVP